MIVENVVTGIKYQIYWQYVETTTICHVLNIDSGAIRSGNTVLAKKDVYSREKGRRVSLKRVLLKAFSGENHYRFRSQVWESYRTLTKIPKWKLKSFK